MSIWCRTVDEGLPIAYDVLQAGVPVLASDGQQVGTVGAVLSAPEEDVFHGLLVNVAGHGIRFVDADSIASIHEHGVDLRIDAAAASALPPPEHRAPVYDEDPQRMKGWHHWVRLATLHGDWKKERPQ